MLNNVLSFNDFAVDWQFGFQDPATSIMEGIIELHHSIFFFLIVITVLVFWMFYKILIHFSYQVNKTIDSDKINFNNDINWWNYFILNIINKNLKSQQINHNSNLEIIWVILPAIVLVFIAIPSFTILYSMDEIFDPKVIVKVIGHQWYWSYEYPGIYGTFNKVNEFFQNEPKSFDSIMLGVDDLKAQKFSLSSLNQVHRLLATDTVLALPVKTHVQILVTSEDVIHSWAVPSLGIKIDCVPGRLNQVSLYVKRSGWYYGQCSEICGINHGFMPISIVVYDNLFDFLKWFKN